MEQPVSDADIFVEIEIAGIMGPMFGLCGKRAMSRPSDPPIRLRNMIIDLSARAEDCRQQSLTCEEYGRCRGDVASTRMQLGRVSAYVCSA